MNDLWDIVTKCATCGGEKTVSLGGAHGQPYRQVEKKLHKVRARGDSEARMVPTKWERYYGGTLGVRNCSCLVFA